MNLKEMMKKQLEYNKCVVGEDLSQEEIERYTQSLALCAHAELSAVVNATHYKHHHDYREPKASNLTVLYETVDVIRYMFAILNTWDISAEEFSDAYDKKDVYLRYHAKLHEKEWDGVQPVAIIDIDDVLADFRNGFAEWLESTMNIPVDINTREYYFITALSKSKHNSEAVFQKFLDEGGFSKIGVLHDNVLLIKLLKDMGFWIHLLTARPEEELQCLYDTYWWLDKYNIPADRLSFSTEKFRWCARSDYYDAGRIIFAMDDAPKHATEYAKHGLPCFVPKRAYNEHLKGENIYMFDDIATAHLSMYELLIKSNKAL